MSELLVERNGNFEVWIIHREQARNALSRNLVSELAEQLERLKRERAIGAVIVTGAGEKAFCAGADLKERQSMSEEEVRKFLDQLRAVLRGIEQSDKIFIAAINGSALGGGTELALACDLRVAAPHAQLGLTEVTLGIIPGSGGTQRLSRLVGSGRAKDLVLTGRRIGAQEALAFGIVERIAEEPADAFEVARSLAETISANAPLALAAAKHAIDDGFALSLDDGLALERRHYETTLGTKDRLEGLAAFREKRAPQFKGE